ncbi:hypothetical protein KDA_69440 [Dictyobacter alpinus]|uniref:HTH arsR-type domain-containing protein n=1 Tax=Dictyobacter alpinus TaxID=2014873 RepID=A0A402BJE0_9CHLR|nr:metalloregulator ArsR/SmtB family transcription factor [Dictyobacter alpinus]GCE31460.1 hypothetical protein KDA_69440 [Dictyobacter alpinus]
MEFENKGPTSEITIQVVFDPVSNALNSFALLSEKDVEQRTDLSPWVVQTATSMTPEQRETNRLVFAGLQDTLTPQRDEPNFPSYLHNLQELNAYVLRKRVLEPLRRRFSHQTGAAPPHTKYLITDLATYLDTVRQTQDELTFDAELQTQVHTLLQHPEELKQSIVSHLESMWGSYFAHEWRRIERRLHWQSDMFANSLRPDASLAETFQEFTGRQLASEIIQKIGDCTQILLLPSWHTGRHVSVWKAADWNGEEWGGQEVARIFFSEPPTYDVAQLRSTPIKQAELQARLGALADETRLRIIELLTRHSELQSQEIIAALDLSQSSISRHLKQLVSMGYLYERRGEGANKTYRLSSYHFARTAQAVQKLAQDDPATQTEQESTGSYNQGLKRFMNQEGRLTMWPPSKQGDKLLILEHLASFFQTGKMYSEKEVNDLLLKHTTFKDPAALRRGLYEYRFMSRKPDGSQYWLIEA